MWSDSSVLDGNRRRRSAPSIVLFLVSICSVASANSTISILSIRIVVLANVGLVKLIPVVVVHAFENRSYTLKALLAAVVLTMVTTSIVRFVAAELVQKLVERAAGV
jgi:hypothetical protein